VTSGRKDARNLKPLNQDAATLLVLAGLSFPIDFLMNMMHGDRRKVEDLFVDMDFKYY
jgi:hypothetical protein